MKKSIGLIVLAACMFIAAPAYAISITVHLAGPDGQALSNANCIAADEHQKAHLFQTEKDGSAKIENVSGPFNVVCHEHEHGNSHQYAAKLDTNTATGKTHKLDTKALPSISIHF